MEIVIKVFFLILISKLNWIFFYAAVVLLRMVQAGSMYFPICTVISFAMDCARCTTDLNSFEREYIGLLQ